MLATVEAMAGPLVGGADELQIDGQRIAFFVPVVLDDARFTRLPDDHEEGIAERWLIAFFDGTSERCQFVVRLHADKGVEASRRVEGRARRYVLLVSASQAGDHVKGEEERIERLSGVLRNSSTLPADKIKGFARGRYVAMDAMNGALFYDKRDPSTDATFRRFVILCCLGLAYRSVLMAFGGRMAHLFQEGALHGDEDADMGLLDGLIRERRGFAVFQARSYTRHPVLADRHEVARLWESIRAAFELDDLRTELEGQLELAHGILADARLRRSEQRDHRQQRRLRRLGLLGWLIGLLLAAAALFEPPFTFDQVRPLIDHARDALANRLR